MQKCSGQKAQNCIYQALPPWGSGFRVPDYITSKIWPFCHCLENWVPFNSVFPKVDLHTMNWQLGLFHPNFSMERYQEILHRPCLKSINPINMSFFSFLILFRHEGLKTENAKLISKYWCKMRTTVVINTDVKNVLKSCVQLSKCFSENIFWLNPRSSFVNVITPRYIHTSFYIYFSSHYNLYL